MTYIENTDDLQWYRKNFGDIWKSATLTFSIVSVNGVQIPNGELSFSREAGEDTNKVLYTEGALSVYKIVSSSPFDLLERVLSGEIPIGEESIDVKSELQQHNPSNYFQDGMREGRVRESRPRMEVNAAINIEVPEDIEDDYLEVIDELDDQLMRAEEPYYDIGRCEGYYFDYIYRSNREKPMILLFGDSGMDINISESGTLEIVSPTSLFEEMFISILPQKPYHEHKGWRITFDDEQLVALDSGLSRYTENLELKDIDEIYAVLYLDDQSVSLVEHRIGDVAPENPRYEIMQAFDQNDNLEGYLEGHNADYFEIAVMNALSTAGWLVQWYGDDEFVIPSFSDNVPGAQYQEIDVIAYHPENSQVLCIECTNQDISSKEQILDRTEAIGSVLSDYLIPTDIGFIEPLQMVPCVATPQTPEELNDDIVNEFEEKNIRVLHCERLKAIYAASEDTTETVDTDTKFIEVI